MRITENFYDPNTQDVQQISVALMDDKEKPYIEIHSNRMTPNIRVQDLGTLIGMLEALKRRAGA